MRDWMMILAVTAVAGCVEDGRRGGTGADGGVGPTGPAGTGIVWKDATGSVIPGVVPNAFAREARRASDYVFPDSAGNWWGLGPGLGVADEAVVLPLFAGLFRIYENSACTGVPYFRFSELGVPPGVVFFDDQSVHVGWKALPATLAIVSYGSSDDGAGGTCSMLPGTEPGISIADLDALPTLTPPSLSAYTPPMHPEPSP